jgi:hypothetical protein
MNYNSTLAVDKNKEVAMSTYVDIATSYYLIKYVRILIACVAGFFGAAHGDTCQHVVSVVHHNYINNDDNSDNSNEPHGIQKRFFCNGFTGCRSSNTG